MTSTKSTLLLQNNTSTVILMTPTEGIVHTETLTVIVNCLYQIQII